MSRPGTLRTYVFRGMVFCSCGGRLCGNHRHNAAYYMCTPRNNNRGASRRTILDADLASLDDRAERENSEERERLQRALAGIMRQAQDGDPDDPFTRALRGIYNELDAERAAMLAAIAALDVAADAEPTRPSPADEALLDALPYLAGNVTTVEQMGEAIGKTPGQSCRTLVASRDMGGLSSHPHGPRRCRRPGPPTVAGPCRPGRM